MNEKEKTQTTILDPNIKVIDVTNILIPECCREGWKSCLHVVKPQKKAKINIGL